MHTSGSVPGGRTTGAGRSAREGAELERSNGRAFSAIFQVTTREKRRKSADAPPHEGDLSSYRSKRRAGRTPEPMPGEDRPKSASFDRGPRRDCRSSSRSTMPAHSIGTFDWSGTACWCHGPCPRAFRSIRARTIWPFRPRTIHSSTDRSRGPSRRTSTAAGRWSSGIRVPTTARSGPTRRSWSASMEGGRPRATTSCSGRVTNRWMIHRMDPPPPGWEPPPGKVEPMLCTPGPPPEGRPGLGLRVQVGRRAGRGRHRRREDPAHDPQRQRHHRDVSRAVRAGRERGFAADGSRWRGGGLRRSPTELRPAPEADGGGRQAAGATVVPGGARDLPGLRCHAPRREPDPLALL